MTNAQNTLTADEIAKTMNVFTAFFAGTITPENVTEQLSALRNDSNKRNPETERIVFTGHNINENDEDYAKAMQGTVAESRASAAVLSCLEKSPVKRSREAPQRIVVTCDRCKRTCGEGQEWVTSDLLLTDGRYICNQCQILMADTGTSQFPSLTIKPVPRTKVNDTAKDESARQCKNTNTEQTTCQNKQEILDFQEHDAGPTDPIVSVLNRMVSSFGRFVDAYIADTERTHSYLEKILEQDSITSNQ